MKEKNGKQAPAKERDEDRIPDRYNNNRLILMARDPYWCYSYWDISPDYMHSKAEEAKAKGNYKLVLRVYDVTDIDFNGYNAHKHQDIEVSGDANNWYINVWEAGRTYAADLGFVAQDGTFILLARSNSSVTPYDKVSNVTDEEWMVVDEDFDELFRLSGGGKTGSSEIMRGGIDFGSDHVSSISSPAIPAPAKKFFLNADTEIVVYGSTEKNAVLKVKGELVELDNNGNFSLRFHLPEGVTAIPVEAESSDSTQKAVIKISIEKKTE